MSKLKKLPIVAFNNTNQPKSKISKPEFIQLLAVELGITNIESEAVCGRFTDLIMELVAEGNTVSITGFGQFAPILRKSRKGVNPRTRKKMTIPAKQSAHFTLGKQFKDKLKNTK
jgi:DNA-binding protein HU-beta